MTDDMKRLEEIKALIEADKLDEAWAMMGWKPRTNIDAKGRWCLDVEKVYGHVDPYTKH